jgi:leucyl-tRNA synthetase
VPGHDIRDFEFAKEFNLPIVRVVVGKDGDKSEITKKEQVQEEEGTMINSGFLNSLDIHKATKEIMDYLEKKKWGRRTIRYKIRDWMISRQRYWGTPVPMIHCSKCGAVPVPEKELPVILPEKVDFKSANPLASNKEFVETKCPKCKGKAKRDTDTMGGFVDSSWYFLRYCDNKNKDKPFDKKKVNYWMPVDQYIGGAEHAVMHLIYARFFVKALKDMGFVSFDEPFTRLFNQGIVYKDGAKMSKSSGNVVFQTEISDKFGIDTARLFMMFVSSPDKQMEWTDNGVGGAFRIINKLINMNEKIKKEANAKEENKINITIKKVTESIESFEYPKAVVALIDAVTYFSEGLSKKSYEILLKLFSPFCPHISEELWEKIGEKGFVSLAEWPKADESKIDMKIEEEEKAVEKTVSDIQNILGIVKEKSGKESKKIYLYVLPNELENYDANALSKRINREVIVFAVNDKKKYDPESKAGKAKPGKPGIFVE